MYRAKLHWRRVIIWVYLLELIKTSLALPKECKVLRNSSGVIESPQSKSGKSYEKNLDLCWEITVARHEYILLKEDYLELDDHKPCRDWIKQSDSKSGLASAPALCGTIKGMHIESMDNTFFIHFKSDSYNKAKGFRLKWTSMRNRLKNEDLISLCPKLKSDGICEKYPTAMEWNCKKTCSTKGNPSSSPPQRECGKAHLAPTDRIVGGNIVPSHKYTWQVGLRYPKLSKYYHCGGSIINADYILTAAHCFYWKMGSPQCRPDMKPTVLQIGLADSNQLDPFDGGFYVYGSELITHPQLNCTTGHYDVALIKLEQPLDFENHEYLAPVCLPENADQTYDKMAATVSGWGKSEAHGSEDILKETSLKIMDVTCGNNTEVNFSQESMLCAKEDNKSGCRGDSGGPLTVEENGRMVQVGVVSSAIGCGLGDHPNIFTRVSKILDWIKNPTKGKRWPLLRTSVENYLTQIMEVY